MPSLTPLAVATLTRQYREHPGWTAQLHADNLRAACRDTPGASYATVRRYLRTKHPAVLEAGPWRECGHMPSGNVREHPCGGRWLRRTSSAIHPA